MFVFGFLVGLVFGFGFVGFAVCGFVFGFDFGTLVVVVDCDVFGFVGLWFSSLDLLVLVLWY